MSSSYCILSFHFKDLEFEKLKKQDNTDHLNKYIDQSKKIDNLEREIRNLKDQLEYCK